MELLLKKHSLNFSIKNTFNKLAKESTQSAEIIKIFESFEQNKKHKGNNHNVVIKSVKSEQFQNMFKKIGPSQKDNKDSIKKNPVFILPHLFNFFNFIFQRMKIFQAQILLLPTI